jgi:hypothetical protein
LIAEGGDVLYEHDISDDDEEESAEEAGEDKPTEESG